MRLETLKLHQEVYGLVEPFLIYFLDTFGVVLYVQGCELCMVLGPDGSFTFVIATVLKA